MLYSICMLTWENICNRDGLGRIHISASAVQALTYQNGDYMGSLNKKTSGAQCFIMALGLFWDIVTGLPWTPNGVGSLGPRGYCIFLPGAHYLTINSPYGADSSLNKLLLLLLPGDSTWSKAKCSYYWHFGYVPLVSLQMCWQTGLKISPEAETFSVDISRAKPGREKDSGFWQYKW